MKNEKTYVIKIDYQNKTICNDDYESVITGILSGNTSFKVLLIDKTGIIDSHINEVTNRYIEDCRSSMSKKVLIESGAAYIKNFIMRFMRLTSPLSVEVDPQSVSFDVIKGEKYFTIDIPKTYVSNKKYDDFLHLGQDVLLASFPKDVIEMYIKPDFYFFLFKNDLLDNPEYNNLVIYMVGLH